MIRKKGLTLRPLGCFVWSSYAWSQWRKNEPTPGPKTLCGTDLPQKLLSGMIQVPNKVLSALFRWQSCVSMSSENGKRISIMASLTRNLRYSQLFQGTVDVDLLSEHAPSTNRQKLWQMKHRRTREHRSGDGSNECPPNRKDLPSHLWLRCPQVAAWGGHPAPFVQRPRGPRRSS
jgi:hypothetical protein